MKSGLVSITFRKLTPEQIVELVARGGLDGIEWGGDVHVPHGELDTARRVADATREAGLEVAAYGSYYRCAESEKDGLTFDTVLETAQLLAPPTVRVWAGRQGSQDADAGYRARVAEDLRRIGAMAEDAGMTVSCEYHTHTLTDTNASAQKLMREVDHPNVRLYWQPPLGAPTDYCLSGLKAILPVLTNLHVFYWLTTDDGRDHRPLAEGRDVWKTYLDEVRPSQREHWALIEFVRGESPDQFLADAATLREWVRPE